MSEISLWRRRCFLSSLAGSAALLSAPGVFADELVRTAAQGEGPFYPDKLPLDTDNDLLIINDGITPAVGQITHLGGRVLDSKGNPLRNALVEIWQVDNRGAYLHTQSANREGRDGNFQGFGRFLTGSKGEYYFRTIKPTPYPGRTPHIHFAVNHRGKRVLTTQCYIKGEQRNKTDRLLNSVSDRASRESVIVDFVPLKHSSIGELAARFDIVLGMTPAG